MNIKDALVEEFGEKLEELKMMNVESEEYKNAVVSLTSIADRIIEIEKNESDKEIKLKAQKDDNKDRTIKNLMTIGTFVISTCAYFGTFIISTNFERFGTFTTPGGQNSVRELLKLKF